MQNIGLRKILGAFKTTPTIPMEVEAALPPPKVRLNTNLRKYAFRALKLSSDHLIRYAIGFGYPNTLSSLGYKGLESIIKE